MSTFGFDRGKRKKEEGSSSEKPGDRSLELSGFTTKTNTPPIEEKTLREADAVAADVGFPSREPSPPEAETEPPQPVPPLLRRKRAPSRPKGQLNIQGPADVLQEFIEYCEENNVTYWEALEQLVPKKKRKK